jgi:hypothetical protein
MAFFGNFPSLASLAKPGAEAPAPQSLAGLDRAEDAKLEGFRKTAIRHRAAPSSNLFSRG